MARDRHPIAREKPITPDTRAEILSAGIRCLVRDGLEGASMASIAFEARVSKALLHYHFAGRAHLLAEMARMLGRRVEVRERAIFVRIDGTTAIELLWNWLNDELTRGELRALLLVRTLREETVVRATTEVDAVRRASVATIVEQAFARLGLTPRVAPALIADATMAFTEGLALRWQPDPRNARTSFDVFWLAILSLGE